MKTKVKMPIAIAWFLGLAMTLSWLATPLTAHASGSYVSPNALLKKKPAAAPAPTPTPEAKKKK